MECINPKNEFVMYLLRVILLQVFDHCSILSSIPWKRKLWAARNLRGWHQIVDLFFVVVVHYRISKYLARNLIFCFCHDRLSECCKVCMFDNTGVRSRQCHVWFGSVQPGYCLFLEQDVAVKVAATLLRCYAAAPFCPSKKNKSMNKTDKK